MSSLVAGFVAQMGKQAASSWGETTPTFEIPSGKRPKRSSPDGEAHDSSVVIIVNSPERASGPLLAFEGTTQEGPREPCASPKDGVLYGGPPDADIEVGEALLEIAVEPSFSSRFANATPIG